MQSTTHRAASAAASTATATATSTATAQTEMKDAPQPKSQSQPQPQPHAAASSAHEAPPTVVTPEQDHVVEHAPAPAHDGAAQTHGQATADDAARRSPAQDHDHDDDAATGGAGWNAPAFCTPSAFRASAATRMGTVARVLVPKSRASACARLVGLTTTSSSAASTASTLSESDDADGESPRLSAAARAASSSLMSTSTLPADTDTEAFEDESAGGDLAVAVAGNGAAAAAVPAGDLATGATTATATATTTGTGTARVTLPPALSFRPQALDGTVTTTRTEVGAYDLFVMGGDSKAVLDTASKCVMTEDERAKLGLRMIDVLVAIPTDLRGRLLGKDGCNIGRITLSTGAHITVATHRDVEVVVSIRSASRDAAVAALDMVLFVEAFHVDDDPATPEETESFLIPSRFVGRIMGVNGNTLEAIRFETRAKIVISSHNEKTIVYLTGEGGHVQGTFFAQVASITGGPTARRLAKAALMEHLNRVHGMGGMGGFTNTLHAVPSPSPSAATDPHAAVANHVVVSKTPSAPMPAPTMSTPTTMPMPMQAGPMPTSMPMMPRGPMNMNARGPTAPAQQGPPPGPLPARGGFGFPGPRGGVPPRFVNPNTPPPPPHHHNHHHHQQPYPFKPPMGHFRPPRGVPGGFHAHAQFHQPPPPPVQYQNQPGNAPLNPAAMQQQQ